MALRVKVTDSMRSQLAPLLSSSDSIVVSSDPAEASMEINSVSNELSQSGTELAVPLSIEEKQKLSSELENGYLSVQTVKTLATKCGIQCTSLLRGSAVTSSSAVDAARTSAQPDPALAQRRQYLQMRQQEREYNRMTFGTDTNPEKLLRAQDGENPYSQMRNQVTVSTNMIVSIFAMFGVGYLIARNMTEDESTRMIAGLVASMSILVVEMTLYILRAVQMENAYEKTKRQ